MEWYIRAFTIFAFILLVNCAGSTRNSPQGKEPYKKDEPGYHPLMNVQITCDETRLKGFYILKFHWPVIMSYRRGGRKSAEDFQEEFQDNGDNKKPDGKIYY